MFKILLIFFILNFFTAVQSSIKEKIISNLEQINNISFNFKQEIDNKNENGNCIIKYPKKIYCEYNNLNKKIIVSNGKNLAIKNRNSGTFYIYPLEKTLLKFLLDKNYLIQKIKKLEYRDINSKYLNFTILEDNNEINIFFDKKNHNLVGWQTEDLYQNLTITFIFLVKINQNIDEKIFILPQRD